MLASATLDTCSCCSLSLCSGPHYFLEPTQEQVFAEITEVSLLAKLKAESFGHGKTWILAKGKNTCKDQILAKHPPGSSFLAGN